MRQKEIYDDAYRGAQRIRRALRFDIRYRCRRLHEVLSELGIDASAVDVLDVGFGGGDLLASFPSGCAVTGVDISRSAVERARTLKRFARFRSAQFELVGENDPDDLPPGPFDVVLSAHTLEHVDDDHRWVAAMRNRTKPGGIMAIFVPVEEPGYNPDHVRTYSVGSLVALLENAGLSVLHSEGSMHLNGHVWKWITIPSRRRWPVLGPAVNTLRLATQASIPYAATRKLEQWLGRLGASPRQALAIGRAP
jgi:SAM-dependent methyltransferase